jgi:TIR domain
VPVQIFISYARDDDETPPGMNDTKGFVGFLYDQLTYEFRRLGQPNPRLWRDTRNIERAQQFEPLLEKEVAASDFLLVVLSRNWLARDWCLRELDTFVKRWDVTGERARERIVVVAKHYIPPAQRPTWLQGQQGYSFFSIDREEILGGSARGGMEREFYERGEVRDPACWGVLKELASYLWRGAGALTAPPVISPSLDTIEKPLVESTGRTIYVAKPAGDMRQAYDSLVEELQRRGYGIEPPIEAEIPHDYTATTFITEALAKAELSIHLLGNKAGFAPEDGEPILKLQLKLAADIVNEVDAAEIVNERRFRRIIWAPKVPTEQADTVESPERDPLAVLDKFDRHVSSDKVEGDNLSKFVDFIIQHLEKTAPSRRLTKTDTGQARVYLHHRVEDQDYAFDLAVALQERNIEPIIPALEGDAADLSAHHRRNLLECDAVILCWANASEVWARASARELSEWRELGRSKRFAYRALVAGPPPAARKNMLVKLPPRSDIDLVLDLTALPKPVPDALNSLVLGNGLAES